jgi:hypothetical protein
MTDKAFIALLREKMNEYMITIGDLSATEKRDLRAWVADGNSVHDNPFSLYDENGHPMDYVNAMRVNTEMYEDYINSTNLFRYDEFEPGSDIEPGILF